ncbi:MAG: hypothetical protein ACR2PL_06290 [Dehalococcoidia bacterium]
MQYRPDIVISDRSGVAVAMIEVKALSGASVETATRYLRNLLAHGVAPRVGYVLLITADTGYLWSTPEAVLHEPAPSLTFPMDRITRHYLPDSGPSTLVGDLVLESIVKVWLSDLADGAVVDVGVTSSLRETGFLNAVRDGLVNAYATA